MKYIPADKLIAEIKRRLKDYWEISFHDAKAYGEDSNVRELKELLTFITSLQQEQPETDLDKLVNEEFASRSQITEYGPKVIYNRAELSRFIKRMALVFNARKEESNESTR